MEDMEFELEVKTKMIEMLKNDKQDLLKKNEELHKTVGRLLEYNRLYDDLVEDLLEAIEHLGGNQIEILRQINNPMHPVL